MPNGGVSEIAPWYFGNGHCSDGGDPAWSYGYIAILDAVYRYYGDLRSIERHYPSARDYVQYMAKVFRAPHSYSIFTLRYYVLTRSK